jgi:glycosyltransferase involved in cell wall biosynthesis
MPIAEQRGGAELSLLDLLRAGRNLEVTLVVVFLEDGPMAAEAAGLGVETRVVAAGRLRQPHRYVAAAFRIARILRRQRADLVCGWMAKAHLYSGPAAMLARVPALWCQLGVPSAHDRLDRIATRIPARGVLPCSRAAAAAQGRLKPGRPTLVVYPGVDLARFDAGRLPERDEARDRLGLPSDRPIAGIVGRLQRWKGMHVLIEAMPRVLERRRDALCLVIGGEHRLEPEYPAFLRRRIAELGLEDHVRLVGFQADVVAWMQAMDVVVHASEEEPFGLVVLEAMALGKPVVASDEAGPTEIITPEVDGLLSPHDDPDALADAILRLFDDHALASRLGVAARSRAQDFSTDSFARSFVDAAVALAGAR